MGPGPRARRAPTSPRATSSSRSRPRVPDRDAPVILYCAGGVRSLFAAQTLAAMGYTDVASMTGGFQAWKTKGLDWTQPVALTDGAEAALQPPPADPRGRDGRPGEAARVEGAAHRRGRARLARRRSTSPRRASARSASSTSTSSTCRTSSARSSTRPTGRREEGRLRPQDAQRAQPGREGRRPRGDARRRTTSSGSSPATTSILDGTDTFETRYILNDAAVAAGIPVVHASVFRFEGQLTTFVPYEGPCYRCLYPTPPPPELAPGCSVAGVLGVVPGIMGLLQANEVLKLLLGHRRDARRPAAPVRCPRDRVHRAPSSGATRSARSAPTRRAPRARPGRRSRWRPSPTACSRSA